MTRAWIACLLIAGTGCVGCVVDGATPPVPDAATSPPELSATVLVSWGGQDVSSENPNDSRVPRTVSGPVKACPDVVGDPVVQVDVELVIGDQHAYVADRLFDCALAHATIPVPAGSGTFRLDTYTASGYAWLSAYSPIRITEGQLVDERANLNVEIPTSGGGGDDGDGGIGDYF